MYPLLRCLWINNLQTLTTKQTIFISTVVKSEMTKTKNPKMQDVFAVCDPAHLERGEGDTGSRSGNLLLNRSAAAPNLLLLNLLLQSQELKQQCK